MNATRSRRVRVVGVGLMGASVGLALCRVGEVVSLADTSPTAVALARDLGAGVAAGADTEAPDLVVVAAPPDVAAQVVVEELSRWPDAVVTDVASVKGAVLRGCVELIQELGGDGAMLSRYVGSHPMAGRERSGAVAAQEDLFEGRPWVICPHAGAAPEAVDLVTWLATRVGGAVVTMSPQEHDVAVASVSHAPQVAASLIAARLEELPAAAVGLAGQGIRDVTRIADSDPILWTQILAGNAGSVGAVLAAVRDDLDQIVEALRRLEADPVEAEGARAVLARAVAAGRSGRARIPGKHGAPPAAYGVVTVVVPDQPGAIAALLTDVGDAGVNLEDMRIEHGVGRPVGSVELVVVPSATAPLATALGAAGWSVHL